MPTDSVSWHVYVPDQVALFSGRGIALREVKGVRNHSQFEIVDDLEAALEQFRLIANDLGGDSVEKVT
jgi:hypothetical protein